MRYSWTGHELWVPSVIRHGRDLFLGILTCGIESAEALPRPRIRGGSTPWQEKLVPEVKDKGGAELRAI